MTYNEYKAGARTTATYPEELSAEYLTLGIRGEGGEVCDKVKKMIRDYGWKPGDRIPQDCVRGIALELGDVMWYAANLAHETKVKMGIGKCDDDDSVDRNYYDPAYYNSRNLVSMAKRMMDTITEESVGKSYVGWVINAVGAVAACIGMKLSEICHMNLDKLSDRKLRDKLNGEGDYR